MVSLEPADTVVMQGHAASFRDSEPRFSDIFRASPVAIAVSELLTGRFMAVNPAMLRVLRARSELEMLGRTSIELGIVTADERERMIGALDGSQQAPGVEVRLRRFDGEQFWAEMSLSRYKSTEGEYLLSTVVDNSERKRLRNAGRHREMLMQVSLDALLILNAEGEIQDANPTALHLIGVDLSKLQGLPLSSLLVNAAAGPELLTSAKRNGFASDFPLELMGSNGTGVPLSVNASILREDSGAIDGYFIAARDVTEQRRAEVETRRMLAAIEQVPESIVITDVGGRILYVNPAFERASGYSKSEVQGKSPRLIKSGEHSPEFYRQLWETIGRGEVWSGILRNRNKSGEIYTESVIIGPVRDPDGQITNFIAVKRDISEELRREQQYRQSQKMECFGQLAGGIAHDFNNILAAIIGHSEVALIELSESHPIRPFIQTVNESAHRGANLTRQLLAFARKQVLERRVLDLNASVQTLAKMLNRLLGEHIRLNSELASDLGRIKADPGQIEQLILNLAINARDAMPEGGTLEIRTSNQVLGAEQAKSFGVAAGEYIRLSVTDTGMGMSEEVKKHIFEPFYTTKEPGKGTGLGLATCFGIVQEYRGAIRFESLPGDGTRFEIYLPREMQNALSPDGARIPNGIGGTETILLVEDDVVLRQTMGLILRRAGYTIIESQDGSEACEFIARNHEAIDLLVTDVVLPGSSGVKVAELLRIKSKSTPVIFISGYVPGEELRTAVEAGNLIQKPFTVADLQTRIRSVLDGRAVGAASIGLSRREH